MPDRPAPKTFAIDQLRVNPDLTFQDMKIRAAMAGISVHHAVFHKARAELGIAPTVRRRRPRAAAPAEPALPAPAPAAPRRAPAGDNRIAELMLAVESIAKERSRLRTLLDSIAAVIEPVRSRRS